MKKYNKNKINDIDSKEIELEIFEVMEKEIETDFEDFYRTLDNLDTIELPDDLDALIDNVIDSVDKETNKKNIKKIYIAAASIVCIIMGIGVYNPALAYKIPILHNIFKVINDTLNIDSISSTIGANKIVPKVEVNEEGSLEVVKVKVKKEKDVVAPTSQLETIRLIHDMSNGIIKAQDIWNCTEITPNTIEMALNGIEYMDETHKSYLKGEIEKWKIGEFANAKEVHNYVWRMLNGTIGEAYGIDNGNIKKIKEKYFSN